MDEFSDNLFGHCVYSLCNLVQLPQVVSNGFQVCHDLGRDYPKFLSGPFWKGDIWCGNQCLCSTLAAMEKLMVGSS